MEVFMLCVSPVLTLVCYWILKLVVRKIKEFRITYNDYKKYKRARDYWLDYDLSPTEYLMKNGV